MKEACEAYDCLFRARTKDLRKTDDQRLRKSFCVRIWVLIVCDSRSYIGEDARIIQIRGEYIASTHLVSTDFIVLEMLEKASNWSTILHVETLELFPYVMEDAYARGLEGFWVEDRADGREGLHTLA